MPGHSGPVDSDPVLSPLRGTILPFRAIHYNTERPDLALGELVAPPGESAALEVGFSERPPYHALDLFPPGGGRARPSELDPDEGARLRETIQRWWQAGVLVQESSPALFLHEQSFVSEQGTLQVRKGFFALLALGPDGTAQVLPHERTLPRRLTRQIQILEALQAQVLPIFLIYTDPGNELQGELEALAAETPPLMAFSDAHGQQHRLTRLDDPGLESWLEARLAGRDLVIADGHHRFDSLRELWRRQGTEQVADLGLPERPGVDAYIAVYLTSVDAPGFRIGAIPRFVRRLPAAYEALRERLEPFYTCTRKPLSVVAPEAAILECLHHSGPGSFGLFAHGESGWDLVQLRQDIAEPFLAELPQELRTLDVTILHQSLLPRLADGARLELDFEKDAARVLAETQNGEIALALLLNPIRPDQIWAVARAGLTLPPKATYFSPKIAAGLVGIPLKGCEGMR